MVLCFSNHVEDKIVLHDIAQQHNLSDVDVVRSVATSMHTAVTANTDPYLK